MFASVSETRSTRPLKPLHRPGYGSRHDEQWIRGASNCPTLNVESPPPARSPDDDVFLAETVLVVVHAASFRDAQLGFRGRLRLKQHDVVPIKDSHRERRFSIIAADCGADRPKWNRPFADTLMMTTGIWTSEVNRRPRSSGASSIEFDRQQQGTVGVLSVPRPER